MRKKVGVVLKILMVALQGFLHFTSPEARQTTADILRFAAGAVAPKLEEGPTLQERISDALKE